MNLKYFLLFLLLCVPILEIYLLILVGKTLGIFLTLLLLFLTAIFGAYLLRTQGLALLLNIQKLLNHGQLPTQELLEAVCILIGGILLLTPGFFTDFLGMMCLFPYSRQYLVRKWMTHFIRLHVVSKTRSNTFEGEYRREEE